MTTVGMSEDELLLGLTDAMTIAGWTWTHSRRSDKAVLMGQPGVPDVIAVSEHRRTLLAWELKDRKGQPTYDQVAWIRAMQAVRTVDARIIRPEDYDQALSVVLHAEDPGLRCVICGRTTELRALDPRSNAGICITHDPGGR